MKWKKTLTKKKVFGGVFNAKWNQNHLIVRQYATQEESETGQERNTGERNTRRKERRKEGRKERKARKEGRHEGKTRREGKVGRKEGETY